MNMKLRRSIALAHAAAWLEKDADSKDLPEELSQSDENLVRQAIREIARSLLERSARAFAASRAESP